MEFLESDTAKLALEAGISYFSSSLPSSSTPVPFTETQAKPRAKDDWPLSPRQPL